MVTQALAVMTLMQFLVGPPEWMGDKPRPSSEDAAEALLVLVRAAEKKQMLTITPEDFDERWAEFVSAGAASGDAR